MICFFFGKCLRYSPETSKPGFIPCPKSATLAGGAGGRHQKLRQHMLHVSDAAVFHVGCSGFDMCSGFEVSLTKTMG